MPCRSLLQKNFFECSDETLMALIKQGEASAFDELYARYSKRLLHFFCRMLWGNKEKAQDFLQETFLRVIENTGQFHPEAKFSAWIFAIAHNLCKNEYRRLEARKVIDRETDVESIPGQNSNDIFDAESEMFSKDLVAAVLKELEKFDESKRSAFLLRYQEGFSIKEISEILGCSEGTVKSRLFYTTKELAARLSAFHPQKIEVRSHEKNT
jgi:RNA polymerase sigma-70 factor (ECF subfamily)